MRTSGPDETRAELILGEDFVCADARVSISASKHSYASPGTEVSLGTGPGEIYSELSLALGEIFLSAKKFFLALRKTS